ncbi:MAG: 4Fe-4S binding protein [Synergistaceae bacterium]|nr:4Fe-4S binding protein [Synergistaceae bacterium]
MAKVVRQMIRIDEDKCDGCGICAEACHEGAIQMIDGKARLVSDIYCDGLGDCIGECPQDAISFEVREADPYDEEAVKKYLAEKEAASSLACGCPGSMARDLLSDLVPEKGRPMPPQPEGGRSGLANWPVQIRLVPENAPYLKKAHLLVAADCTPFAFPAFHETFLAGDRKVCLVGCPKLDDAGAYAEKLARIISSNEIDQVTEVRMEVPCCGGLTRLLEKACEDSGREMSLKIFTISVSGDIIDRETIRFKRAG